jgi:ribokinase
MGCRIAVIGNINVDFVFCVPRLPKEGETLPGEGFFTAPGGKGANQAVAAARLGADVAFIGAVGDDDLGERMLKGLEADGIDVSRVRRDPSSHTGTALIMVLGNGENSIVVAFGANLSVGPGDLEQHAPLLRFSDALLLQLEMRVETVDAAIGLGRDAGCRVILDPAPARPESQLPGRWRAVDVLSPNETETEIMLGCPPLASLEDALAAAEALAHKGPEVVALKLGARGSVVLSSGEGFVAPAFPVEAVDTTAAGDAYTAGLAVALSESLSLGDAARFANACGALAATRYGAQPSMPRRADVEALLSAT